MPFIRPFFRARLLRHGTSTRQQSSSAASIAKAFLDRFQSLGPQTRTQVLDANQLQLLSLTLNRPQLWPGVSAQSTPSSGTPLPPGYHLVYFTPTFLEAELGADGTDTSYNPASPFTRRMWAGGEVEWSRVEDGRAGGVKSNLLRVGQEVKETTTVLGADPKIVKKTGEEMIVVGVEKTFENEDGVALIDRRNWVFRKALELPKSSNAATIVPSSPIELNRLYASTSTSSTTSPSGTKVHTRSTFQTPTTLFRFSALTFNPHKIHYSLPWAQQVEGHKGIVVHGPLNLISMLDLWRDVRTPEGFNEQPGIPEKISYRATSPLYADQEYQIVLEEEGNNGKINIYNPSGVVAMKGEIVG